MRKITKEVCEAFQAGRKLLRGNTGTDGKALFLHGHRIAEYVDGYLYIDSCGWNTRTTRDRLNGLDGVRVTTKRGQMYINGKKWDGNRALIVQSDI
jgi:hypothetical protein